MAIPIPDRRLEAFVKGWTVYRGGALHQHEYWNPSAGAWEVYKPGTYTISDTGIPPPDFDTETPEDAYRKVEQSWASIRAQHPTAVLDPVSKGWRTATLVKPPTKPGGDKPSDDLKERERLAKLELEGVDRQYRDRILNHDEWVQRRKEIRQKYGLE